MQMTIKSRKLGKTLTFWKQAGGDKYIYLVTDDKPGTLGRQLCCGGHLGGLTLSAIDEDFEYVCRSWYKAHVKQVTSCN